MLSETAVRIQPLPRIVFGVGSSADIAKHMGIAGKGDVLIVTDKGIVQAGIVATIAKSLEAAGISVQIFDGVEPNPTDKNVDDGVDVLNAMNGAIVKTATAWVAEERPIRLFSTPCASSTRASNGMVSPWIRASTASDAVTAIRLRRRSPAVGLVLTCTILRAVDSCKGEHGHYSRITRPTRLT